MHQNMPKPIHKIGVAILTTILSGLSLTIYNIFTQSIPTMEKRIEVLDLKVKTQDKYLERIDNRTEKIYEILIQGK